MLKKLSVLSFLYSVSVLALSFFVLSNETRIDIDDEELWSAVTLFIHACMQFGYTLRIRRNLDLIPYKDMNTLDDFLAQPMDVDTSVVENSGWMKTLGFLGILGAIVSIVTGAAMFYYILETLFSSYRELTEISLVFISLAALGFGVPTLILNIRTFSMKWIKGKSD